MDKYKIELVFTEPLLGTVPLNKEIYADYIRTKAVGVPEEKLDEEMDTVMDSDEKGVTGFHEVDGGPVLMDYAIKGFFKEACYFMRRIPKTASSKLAAFRKIIDGLVFVFPRYIPLEVNGETYLLRRPLRGNTAQGERVSLAGSVTAPIGTKCQFTIMVLNDVSEEILREWLEYGALHGLGQWRNASWGRFSYTLEKIS